MRTIFLCVGLVLVGCSNNTTSSEWRPIQSAEEARFEKAKAICNGRASETGAMAGRAWIAGAIYADSAFKGCMAEQGFIRN
ncbi:hypothetical protein [Pararhizobium sp. LjRoot238]|uniref:hypothetical protein n=1 Tax=Pararhizobium sp. LjRoot238 TaxID=3342293 RepID=UPI003ED00BD4